MAGSYRPQSPDLSSLHNTNLSGYRPQSPDLSALSSTTFEGVNPFEQHQQQQHQQQRQRQQQQQQQYNVQFTPQHITSTPNQQFDMPAVRMKQEDETMTGMSEHSSKAAIKSEATDPTLGVELKTSFPVARIKRIMQADEDIGKVAQVTPHVVSRALELFMIKLIAASSEQARQAGGANAKGPKRVLVQHMKKAIQADDTFDFLADIITKVPDAPSKAKKEANSDSEDAKPKKRVRKQKSNDD